MYFIKEVAKNAGLTVQRLYNLSNEEQARQAFKHIETYTFLRKSSVLPPRIKDAINQSTNLTGYIPLKAVSKRVGVRYSKIKDIFKTNIINSIEVGGVLFVKPDDTLYAVFECGCILDEGEFKENMNYIDGFRRVGSKYIVWY